MFIEWIAAPSGKWVQACCYCGKPIPATRPRYFASRETNPHSVATIRHPSCKGKVLHDKHGKRLFGPSRVVTEV